MLDKMCKGIRRLTIGGLTALMLAGLVTGQTAWAADQLPEEATAAREEKKEDHIAPVKNCVVEIRSGFEKEDGSIDYLKNGSGVVISADSASDDVFILTTYKTCHCGKKKKKNYCKEHKLNIKEVNLTSVVRVATTGNASLEAEIYQSSKEFNYCILKCSAGLKNKDAVMMGQSSALVTGETLISMGFEEENPAGTQGSDYEKEQVTLRFGKMQDQDAENENRDYLQHDAEIEEGMTGGPLVNEKGELVGINDAGKTEEDEKTFYAIPSDEIRKMLDSLKIHYTTHEMIRQQDEFQKALEKSQRLLEDKNYKENSKKDLEEAVEKGRQLLETQEATPEQYARIEKELKAAEKQLVLKMKTSRKIIIVLAVVVGILFLWFLKHLIWWIRHRKRGDSPKEKEGRSYAETRDTDRRRKKKKAGRDREGRTSRREDKVYEEEERIRREAYRRKKKERESTGPDRGKRYDIPADDRIRHHSDKDYRPETPPAKAAGLYYTRTGQFKKINRVEFHVGKRSDNDFVIDNRQVSRNHMVIRWERTHYTITDLDSVNGTVVNGKKITPGKAVDLHNDDQIFLANEEFIFRMLD